MFNNNLYIIIFIKSLNFLDIIIKIIYFMYFKLFYLIYFHLIFDFLSCFYNFINFNKKH